MTVLRTAAAVSVSFVAALGAGCSADLTESSVRRFIDAADRAYLDGRAGEVCAMRAEEFQLEYTEFDLSGSQVVSSAAEAESIAAQRQDAGELIEGKSATLGQREFCQMAYESHQFFKRATMERGSVTIAIDPRAGTALVRAHYTIKEPVYAYAESPLSMRDQVETQVATKQTEADDTSVVAVREGELKFISTRSVGKVFRVAKRRDRRL
jgi:hypothetical protein